MLEQEGGRIALPPVESGIVTYSLPGADAKDGADAKGGAGGKRYRARPFWRLRNWRVRWRLLALVAIPTVAAIVFGFVRIQTARDTASDFAQVSQLAGLGSDVTALADAIEDERDLTAGYIAAGQAGSAGQAKVIFGELSRQYGVTGARLATVQRLAATIGPAYPAVARSDLAFALSRVSALTNLRGLAHSQFLPLPMIGDYSDIVSTLLAFDNEIAAGNSSAELAQTVASLGSLAQLEDQVSQQRALLYVALLQGQFQPGVLNALVAAESGEASDLATYQTAADALPAYVPGSGFSAALTEEQQFNNDVAGPAIDEAQSIEQSALVNGDNGGAPPPGDAQMWFSDMSATVSDIRGVENAELGSISAQGSAAQQSAENSVRLTAAVVLVLLLLVLLVTILVARSMIIPLRRLRTDALDVAGRRLPAMVQRLSQSRDAAGNIEVEPIGIDSSDEIGEVARAFDQVHGEAVRLAGEEAVLRANLNAMFVNLSRRSQSLIERQLGIIESLEHSEQDSGRLSSLFRLDHLATRMRRNSENLLVLAGHETPRKWTQPVPLVDVLRAAISEIEHYERIVVNVQPGLVIAGRAASDVVHLVAELTENATMFSRQDTQVLLSSQLPSSGGALIEIADNGLGIPEQELAYANWRLDNPPVIDVAVSRRMGLFVVGRLAARHGIKVRLRQAPGGGLSALIWVPEAVAEVSVEQVLGPRQRSDPGPRPTSAPLPAGPAAPAGPADYPLAVYSPAAARAAAAGPVGSSWFQASSGPQPDSRGRNNVGANSMGPNTVGMPSAEPHPHPGAGQVRADTSQLPIYNAVESEWFRRGGGAIATGGQYPDWTSPADDGFRAAETVISPAVDPLTNAGLPQRVPRANLVPGSIVDRRGSQQAAPVAPTTARPPARSPEAVRTRMTGFQLRGRAGRSDAPQHAGTDQS